MFSNMSGEVRNLLLVASELGGEVAQYVKVLRKEKERLLPIDEVQGEMEKLMKERDQAVASEESMFRALTKANDSKYAERRKVDSLKEQLAKQAEQLEHMQSNMVHANVYQRVAAERDRALAELRTNEHSYMREVDTLNRAITKLEASLAEREQYEKEVHQSLITQRDDALTTVAKEKARRETVEGEVAAALDQRDNMSIQLREWFQFFKKAIMATGTTVEELERTCYNREDLLVAISALRKWCDDLALSMKHEQAAHERLHEKYGKVQAKLLNIEALVGKPLSDIHTVASKAAEGVSCHNAPRVVADAVASFIRTPIRHELNS